MRSRIIKVAILFIAVFVVLVPGGAQADPDLVDVTVFLTDMKTDFAAFNHIYAEYFDQCRPCRTTVEVGALPTAIAVELKCIAHVQSRP